MNHKWTLLLFLMITSVYADSKQHIPHSSHIASLYLPKRAQLKADQHTQEPPLRFQQVHHIAQQQRQKPDNSLDIQKNQLNDNAFYSRSWGDPVMRMYSENEAAAEKSTTPLNLIVSGLKTFTALFDGIVNNGIYKLDSQSPVQNFIAALLSELTTIDSSRMKTVAREMINIEVSLLDIMKTSFIRQPLAAGRSVNDMAIASIAMLKGFAKSTIGSSEGCLQEYMCEANAECRNDIGEKNIYCQIGNFATSFVLEKTTGRAWQKLYQAGQQGKRGESCQRNLCNV